MKVTLVTGANGHVGFNITRLLAERGERVRAMIRASADVKLLERLDVEIVRGDIMDPASTAAAVDRCARVYHTAAGFLMWAKDPERDIIRPSVEGTRNVLEAAARAGVEKVVYTSTTGTMGLSTRPDDIVDESRFNEHPHTHYVRGKIAAEKEAFAIAKRTGLAMCSTHPGLILGPRFTKPSESVRQVADFLNQGTPLYFEGGFGVVDAEDVARGSLAAMEKGRSGERYILSGENVTVKGLFDILAELTGLPAPKLKAPVAVVRWIAGAMELGSKLTGSRPMLDRSQVDEFAGHYGYFSSAKAERELGYRYLSARETLARTVAWLIDHGFVAEKRLRLLKRHPSLANAYAN
jgi:dihydroflavonol-4-reductase